MFSRTCTFTAKNKSYSFNAPTVGEMIAIDGQKIALSNGKYQQMMNIHLVTTQSMLDMIDAEATLSVMCPQFMQDLKTPKKTLMAMDVVDAKQFLDEVYRKQIAPWWIGLNKVLQAPLEKPEEKKDVEIESTIPKL